MERTTCKKGLPHCAPHRFMHAEHNWSGGGLCQRASLPSKLSPTPLLVDQKGVFLFFFTPFPLGPAFVASTDHTTLAHPARKAAEEHFCLSDARVSGSGASAVLSTCSARANLKRDLQGSEGLGGVDWPTVTCLGWWKTHLIREQQSVFKGFFHTRWHFLGCLKRFFVEPRAFAWDWQAARKEGEPDMP